jgi:hypothetical protein
MSEKQIRYYALKSKGRVKLLEFPDGIDKAKLAPFLDGFKETVQNSEDYQHDQFLAFLKSNGVNVDFVITGGVIELN